MPESKPNVTIRIEYKPVTPFQKRAWDKFWSKITEDIKLEEKDDKGDIRGSSER